MIIFLFHVILVFELLIPFDFSKNWKNALLFWDVPNGNVFITFTELKNDYFFLFQVVCLLTKKPFCIFVMIPITGKNRVPIGNIYALRGPKGDMMRIY